MKSLPKDKITAVLDRLAGEARIYVPLQDEATSSFGLWSVERTSDLVLDSLNTTFSPKGLVFPQTETMYGFTADHQQVKITGTHDGLDPSILFGARACDRRGIANLDQVFLRRGYVDTSYQARRDRLTVIGITCARPGPLCFCSSMGVDPMGAEVADVLLHEDPDRYAWEPVTTKGRDLINRLDDLLVDAGDFARQPAAGCQLELRTRDLPARLNGLFDHPVWDELSSRCINCGICTYVCPSCHCFDIQVENRGQSGSRFRCWDSCMYQEYNLMAGGHNPRANKRDRFRNRFLDKLEFFPERYGSFGCSGCGRCVALCPSGISIVSIINRMGEVNADVSR